MKANQFDFPRILLDERKTIDLCTHEHNGQRCLREKDHEGTHECISLKTGEPATSD